MKILQKKSLNISGIGNQLFIYLFFFVLLDVSVVSARSVLNIRHVKTAYAIKNKETGNHDRVCVGEVFFEDLEKGIEFFCDSAYEHVDTKIIEAFGEVKITQGDTLKIIGEYMSYNQETDFVKVRKNTRLEHIRAILYTDSLDYDMNSGIGYYQYGGKLVDSTSVLTSRIGIYETEKEVAFFKKNVEIEGKDYTIKTDSLRYLVKQHQAYIIAPTDVLGKDYKIYTEAGVYDTNTGISNFTKATKISHKEQTLEGDFLNYDSKKGISILKNNCELKDTINNINLYSNYIKRDEKEKQIVFTDSILLKYIMDADTLYAHADTILLDQKTEKDEKLEIFHHVKFYKNDFQGICDSMTFISKDSVLNMYKNPVLWSGENQLTADTIIVTIANESLDHIDLRHDAFVSSQDNSAKKYYNQMRGRNMVGFVEQDTLRRMEVYGNGESIYFMKEGLEYIGFNTIKCSNITVRLKKGKLNTIVFRESPNGITYPMSYTKKIPLYLKGFRWEESNRPFDAKSIYYWNNEKPIDFSSKNRGMIIEDEQK